MECASSEFGVGSLFLLRPHTEPNSTAQCTIIYSFFFLTKAVHVEPSSSAQCCDSLSDIARFVHQCSKKMWLAEACETHSCEKTDGPLSYGSGATKTAQRDKTLQFRLWQLRPSHLVTRSWWWGESCWSFTDLISSFCDTSSYLY